jgi:hypothetical protein
LHSLPFFSRSFANTHNVIPEGEEEEEDVGGGDLRLVPHVQEIVWGRIIAVLAAERKREEGMNAIGTCHMIPVFVRAATNVPESGRRSK